MKTEKTNRALDFVVRCINELNAEGFQTWEDIDGQVPEGDAPDTYFYDENTLTVRFGNDVYKATFRKVKQS